MIGRFAAGSYCLFLRIIFICNPVKLLFVHFVCFVWRFCQYFKCRIMRWSINNECLWTCKESVVAYFEMLSHNLRYCLTIWNTVSQFEIMSHNCRYCLTLWDIVSQFEILSHNLRYCLTIWDTVSHFAILSHNLRYSLTLWDIVSQLEIMSHTLPAETKNRLSTDSVQVGTQTGHLHNKRHKHYVSRNLFDITVLN
jgi:hypothetical protein